VCSLGLVRKTMGTWRSARRQLGGDDLRTSGSFLRLQGQRSLWTLRARLPCRRASCRTVLGLRKARSLWRGGVTVMSTAASFKAFSEGAGVLLLERLSDAERNGHPILSVIRGSAINNVARQRAGPAASDQQRVIQQRWQNARLSGSRRPMWSGGTGSRRRRRIIKTVMAMHHGRRSPDVVCDGGLDHGEASS